MDSATLLSVAVAVRRRWWMMGIMLFAVMAADVAIIMQTPRSYLARTELLIGPSTTVDPGQLVYSVDALGRAMIVGTYANVLSTDVVRRDALRQAGVSPDVPDTAIQIKAATLADSAVVQVTTIAPDPNQAAAVANAVGQVGGVRMAQLYPMYELTVVTAATPPTVIYRPDVMRSLSLGLLIGLLGGVGFAWMCDALARAR